MIRYKRKDLSQLSLGSRAIAAVYKGSRLIWEAIRSCFGKGFWIGKYCWDGKDAWKSLNE